MSSDLPPFVVSGEFAADGAGEVPRLGTLPATIEVGSLYEQGFPCFAGVIDFEQSVSIAGATDDIVLDLGKQRDTFEVFVNGSAAGVLSWPPYHIGIGHLLQAGQNVIKLRLLTAMGGVLNRHHKATEENRPPVGLLDVPTLVYGSRS